MIRCPVCPAVAARLSLFIAILVFHGPPMAIADSKLPEAANAMWSTLADLHTGTGTGHWSGSPGPAVREGPAEYSFIFDFDRGLSRVDRLPAGNDKPVQRIDSPDGTVLYDPHAGIAERAARLSDAPVPNAGSFDVRILGLVSLPEFQIGETWEELRSHYMELGPPSATTEEGGLIALTWERAVPVDGPIRNGKKFSLFRRVTFVDPLERFLPKRTEIWTGGGQRGRSLATFTQ